VRVVIADDAMLIREGTARLLEQAGVEVAGTVGDARRLMQIVTRLVRRPRRKGPLDELTEREREVLALIAEGRSNQGIAEVMVLSPKTVEAHVGRIFSKLGLNDTPDHHRRVLAVLAFLRS
jgi:DNA-binding NarL/FixJ family response regulator